MSVYVRLVSIGLYSSSYIQFVTVLIGSLESTLYLLYLLYLSLYQSTTHSTACTVLYRNIYYIVLYCIQIPRGTVRAGQDEGG